MGMELGVSVLVVPNGGVGYFCSSISLGER